LSLDALVGLARGGTVWGIGALLAGLLGGGTAPLEWRKAPLQQTVNTKSTLSLSSEGVEHVTQRGIGRVVNLPPLALGFPIPSRAIVAGFSQSIFWEYTCIYEIRSPRHAITSAHLSSGGHLFQRSWHLPFHASLLFAILQDRTVINITTLLTWCPDLWPRSVLAAWEWRLEASRFPHSNAR
jgi:hypothetical protein